MVCGLLALSESVSEDPEETDTRASLERPLRGSFLSDRAAGGLCEVLRLVCGAGGGV